MASTTAPCADNWDDSIGYDGKHLRNLMSCIPGISRGITDLGASVIEYGMLAGSAVAILKLTYDFVIGPSGRSVHSI